MKKKTIIYLALLIIIAAGIYFFLSGSSDKETKYTFSEIQRGDVSNTITSTGTLEALKTVDVGTQVSGRIDRIFVDFNSNVKKGKLLAVLDTVSLALQVSDAQSNLEKAKAQYDQASAEFERDKGLYDKGYLSELDYMNSKTSLESTLSDYHSSQTALQRAKTNLSYAYIYSPISGTIISRNVEEGQTVAASLSTPTLFEIAENLSNMQILASVDESDIGQIKVGQEAEFTVQAYPDKNFTGKVVQIRLNSSVDQNVVNYTVVVNAQNDSLLLLPGMTATIDFYIDKRENVLTAPNSALKFQPTEEMLAELKSEMKKEPGDSLKSRSHIQGRNFNHHDSVYQSGKTGLSENQNMGTLWYFDQNGKLRMSFVKLGLSDGKKTEIIGGRNLKEGMKVITGTESNSETSTTSTSRNILSGRGFGPRH